jgi:cytochrome bd-type quinol oxidase subunit 1
MVALTVVHTVTGALVLAVTLVTALLSYRMLRVDNAVADSAPASEQVAH